VWERAHRRRAGYGRSGSGEYAERGVSAYDSLGDEALCLWNALFGPRDILDPIKGGRTEDEAASRLVTVLRGALICWSAAPDRKYD